MKSKKSMRRKRRGTTAVEFAVVAPVAMAFIFGLLEMFNLYKINGMMTSALLNGSREASIRTSDASDVEDEIRSWLNVFGANASNITITPANFDFNTDTIDVAIELDATPANGFYLRKFFSGTLRRQITVERF